MSYNRPNSSFDRYSGSGNPVVQSSATLSAYTNRSYLNNSTVSRPGIDGTDYDSRLSHSSRLMLQKLRAQAPRDAVEGHLEEARRRLKMYNTSVDSFNTTSASQATQAHNVLPSTGFSGKNTMEVHHTLEPKVIEFQSRRGSVIDLAEITAVSEADRESIVNAIDESSASVNSSSTLYDQILQARKKLATIHKPISSGTSTSLAKEANAYAQTPDVENVDTNMNNLLLNVHGDNMVQGSNNRNSNVMGSSSPSLPDSHSGLEPGSTIQLSSLDDLASGRSPTMSRHGSNSTIVNGDSGATVSNSRQSVNQSTGTVSSQALPSAVLAAIPHLNIPPEVASSFRRVVARREVNIRQGLGSKYARELRSRIQEAEAILGEMAEAFSGKIREQKIKIQNLQSQLNLSSEHQSATANHFQLKESEIQLSYEIEKAKTQALEKETERLAADLAKEVSKSAGARSRIQDLEAQISQYQSILNEKQDVSDKSIKDLESLKLKMQETVLHSKRLEVQIAELAARESVLKTTISTLESAVSAAESERDNAQASLSTATSESDALRSKIQNLESINESSVVKLESLERALAESRAALEQKSVDHGRDLERVHSEFGRQIRQLEGTMQSVSTEFAEFRDVTAREAEAHETARLNAEMTISSLRRDLEGLVSSGNILRNGLEQQLREAQEKLTSSQALLSASQAGLERAESEAAALRQRLEEAQARHERHQQELQAENEARLKSAADAASTDLRNLEEKHTRREMSLQQQLDEAHRHAESLQQSLEQRLREQEAVCLDLRAEIASQNSEIAKKSAEIGVLSAEKRGLEDQLAEQRANAAHSLDMLRRDVAEGSAREQELDRRLVSSLEICSRLESQIASERAERVRTSASETAQRISLESRLDESNSLNSSLKDQLSALNAQIRSLEEEKASLQSQLQEMQLQVAQGDERLQEVTGEAHSLSVALSTRDSELGTLRSKLSAAEARAAALQQGSVELESAFAEERAGLRAAAAARLEEHEASLLREREAVRVAKRALSEAQESVTEAERRGERLRAELQEVCAELQEARTETEELRRAKQTLQAQVAAAELATTSAAAKLARQEAQLARAAAAEEQLAALEARQRAEARDAAKALAASVEKFEECQEQLKRVQRRAETLTEEVQQLRAAQTELEALRSEQRAEQRRAEALERELAQTTQRLKDSSDSADILRDELEETKRKLWTAERAVARAEDEGLPRELGEALAAATQLRSENENLRARAQTVELRSDTLSHELELARAEIGRMRVRLSAEEARVAEELARGTAEREALESRIQAQRERADARLQTERESLEARLHTERETLESRLQTERESLETRHKSEREVLEARVAGLSLEVTSLKQAHLDAKTELDSATTQLQAEQQQLRERSRHLQQLESRLQELELQFQEKSTRLQQREAELQAAHANAKEAADELVTLKSTLLSKDLALDSTRAELTAALQAASAAGKRLQDSSEASAAESARIAAETARRMEAVRVDAEMQLSKLSSIWEAKFNEARTRAEAELQRQKSALSVAQLAAEQVRARELRWRGACAAHADAVVRMRRILNLSVSNSGVTTSPGDFTLSQSSWSALDRSALASHSLEDDSEPPHLPSLRVSLRELLDFVEVLSNRAGIGAPSALAVSGAPGQSPARSRRASISNSLGLSVGSHSSVSSVDAGLSSSTAKALNGSMVALGQLRDQYGRIKQQAKQLSTTETTSNTTDSHSERVDTKDQQNFEERTFRTRASIFGPPTSQNPNNPHPVTQNTLNNDISISSDSSLHPSTLRFSPLKEAPAIHSNAVAGSSDLKNPAYVSPPATGTSPSPRFDPGDDTAPSSVNSSFGQLGGFEDSTSSLIAASIATTAVAFPSEAELEHVLSSTLGRSGLSPESKGYSESSKTLPVSDREISDSLEAHFRKNDSQQDALSYSDDNADIYEDPVRAGDSRTGGMNVSVRTEDSMDGLSNAFGQMRIESPGARVHNNLQALRGSAQDLQAQFQELGINRGSVSPLKDAGSADSTLGTSRRGVRRGGGININ